MLNTIQINKEEEGLILKLKKELGFKNKKAAVLAAVKKMLKEQEEKKRREQLQKAVIACREESLKINQEMAPFANVVLHPEIFGDED